ncbi:hypothetical protein P886_3164 [Alteromonadaceae bacterium 2753L.S.0a.02]|nr:hypothetical protein P886_3164 [Alteromonadaceae bacterium 2753L.S.0a.02]
MILETYAENALLCNVSVSSETSTAGTYAFRGDMVIVEGEIADAQGRRHPPKAVVKQAVVLITADKMSLIAGLIDDLATLPVFIEKYGSDFADDITLMLYIANISRPMIIDIEGLKVTAIPHDGGAVWTLLMDDIRLEKSDFKGQSAEDKVITMVEGIADFKPKYEEKSYNDALGFTVEIKKEARGPV